MHELTVRKDGTLGVKLPETIENSFCRPVEISCQGRLGSFEEKDGELFLESKDGFDWAKLACLPGTCLFETVISWEEGTDAVGLMIHADQALEKWCQLRLEINRGRILMDRYNRVDGDQQYLDERPIRFQSNSAQVKLVISGNIMLVYVDDVALTSRCYEIGRGEIGMFAEYGTAACTNSKLLMQESAEE